MDTKVRTFLLRLIQWLRPESRERTEEPARRNPPPTRSVQIPRPYEQARKSR